MDLDAASWSRLPFEIVEKVLSFLPVPDLCRYQTVCKTWNKFICNPVFCTLHARNARCQESSFLAVRNRCNCRFSKICTNTPPGISFILDLSSKRWYEVDDKYGHNFFSNVVAMDGSGLVCQDGTGLDIDNNLTFIVHNLLGNNTSEVLPTAPTYSNSIFDPEIHLFVDKNSQAFKIFLLNGRCLNMCSDDMNPDQVRLLYLNNPLLNVYDSTTNEWKTSSNPSGPSRILSNLVLPHVRSSVMLQGILYVLFWNQDVRSKYPLWRYKHSEDVWEKVEMDILIYDHALKCPELVVSANRLFLVTWFRKPYWCSARSSRFERGYLSRSTGWVFQVREFQISGDVISSEVVFELSKANVILRFGIEYGPCLDFEDECPIMNVFGVGNFLVIMSNSTGEVKVFDVVTRELDRDHYWPPVPVLQSPIPEPNHWSWFGNHMNLLLPNTPLYGGSSRRFSDLCSEIHAHQNSRF